MGRILTLNPSPCFGVGFVRSQSWNPMHRHNRNRLVLLAWAIVLLAMGFMLGAILADL